MVVHRCGGWSARIRCTGGYPSSSSTTFNVNCILFFTHSWSEAHISGPQVIILPRLQLRTTSRVPTNCKRSTSSMSYSGASSCVSASLALPSSLPPTFKTNPKLLLETVIKYKLIIMWFPYWLCCFFVLFCFECRRRNVAKKNCIYGELRHERVSLGSLDLIHDTPHLCTCFRVDGIKAMSRDISWEKQVIKFSNTSKRGRICFNKTRRLFNIHAKRIVRVSTSVTSSIVCFEDL